MITDIGVWFLNNMNINTLILGYLVLKVAVLEEIVIEMTEVIEGVEFRKPPVLKFFSLGIKK